MRENQRVVRIRVGRNVRRLRRQRGWSQERLAEAADKDQKHIGQIERGEVNVSLDTLADIATGLSVTVGDLFGPALAAAEDLGGPRVYSMARRDIQQIERALRTLQRVRQPPRRRIRVKQK